jgi:acetyltransferase-like isoleucine patch superfamily enzyme
MDKLPEWFKLKNEIGREFNDFCIIRGREYIKFGNDVWIGYFCLVDGSGGLEIGDRVSISSGVHIYTHDSTEYRRLNTQKDPINGSHIKRSPVKIGSNVQIGANAVIAPGVTIGDNVVIGALSFVNKNISSNTIAVGSPCKVIKEYDNNI